MEYEEASEPEEEFEDADEWVPATGFSGFARLDEEENPM